MDLGDFLGHRTAIFLPVPMYDVKGGRLINISVEGNHINAILESGPGEFLREEDGSVGNDRCPR